MLPVGNNIVYFICICSEYVMSFYMCVYSLVHFVIVLLVVVRIAKINKINNRHLLYVGLHCNRAAENGPVLAGPIIEPIDFGLLISALDKSMKYLV